MSYPPPPPPQPNQPQPNQPYQQYGAPPPQQYGGPQPPYQPPPPAKKGRSGCLVGAIIAVVVVLVVCAVGGFFVWRVAKDVSDTVKGSVPGLGGVDCPTEQKVSGIVGTDVTLQISGSVVVAAGCNYSGGGLDITIVKGAGVIADDEIQSVRDDAAAAGVEPRSIDPGDDGIAYGSATTSEAITKADSSVIEVDIASSNGTEIGDKSDEAVEVLQAFIDVQ